MAKDIRTGIGIWASRFLDPTGAADSARALQATGQVDQFALWDQMTSWWPNCLWTPENTPLADQIPDMDSLQDPFATAAFALAGVDRLGFAMCTDATRREPPELSVPAVRCTDFRSALHVPRLGVARVEDVAVTRQGVVTGGATGLARTAVASSGSRHPRPRACHCRRWACAHIARFSCAHAASGPSEHL